MNDNSRELRLADLVAHIDIAMALHQQGRSQDAAATLESAYAAAHRLDL